MGGRCVPFAFASYFECERETTGKVAVIIPGQILCICVDSRYTYLLSCTSLYICFFRHDYLGRGRDLFLSLIRVFTVLITDLAMHSPCRLSIGLFDGPGVFSDALCTACCATLYVCVTVVFLCYDSSSFVRCRKPLP